MDINFFEYFKEQKHIWGKKAQIFFRVGRHYQINKELNNLISQINHQKNEDYLLIRKFSGFCSRKNLNKEAIDFLNKYRKQTQMPDKIDYLLFKHSSSKKYKKSLIRQVVEKEFGKGAALRLEGNFDNKSTQVKSKYKVLDGVENFGFISHKVKINSDDTLEKKKFLTKIGFNDKRDTLDKELLFYTKIKPTYEKLNDVIPDILKVDFSKDKALSLITMRKIKGDVSQRSEINLVIDLHFDFVQKCMYNQSLNDVIKSEFLLSDNQTTLCKAFNYVDQEEYLIKIIEWIKNKISLLSPSSTLRSSLEAFISILVKFNITDKIQPKKHFSLNHGDFHLDNVLVDSANSRLYIIDWAYAGYGPKLTDLSHLMHKECLSYFEVKEMIINRLNDNSDYDLIDKILFYFSGIVSFLMYKRYLSEDQNYFIDPFIKDFNKLLLVNNK